jgi:hypothetical protein
MTTIASSIKLPRRNFTKDNSSKEFYQKAVGAALIMHIVLCFIHFPEEKIKPQIKEKLGSIKMNYIKPSESYHKKELAKDMAQKAVKSIDAGVKTVATTNVGATGDPKSNNNQESHKSKSGSAKKGPLSSPNAVATGLGDSSSKGYEFKGKGLKALMGNSATMSMASGNGSATGVGRNSGSGIGNKGNNLTGDYRAPAGTGDGTGHLAGTDSVGNYDRSTSTKGLANKKGFDTAFVQSDTVVLGSIDPEILRKILGEYLAQFKFCYQQELQEQSEKIKGIVDLNFRIEGDGKVSTVNIKSAQTKFSNKGIGCMSNILRMIDFPKPKGGGLVDVRQPLNFFSESTKI